MPGVAIAVGSLSAPLVSSAPLFDPVVIITGDSMPAGQASDEAAYNAAYAPDPLVRALRVDGSFIQWAPGTFTGLRNLVNDGKPGVEAGLINTLKAAYPGRTLTFLKLGNPGCTQTLGLTTGSITGSIANQVLTVSAGTPLTNDILVNDGVVPPGTQVVSYTGPGGFVRKAGQTANPVISVPAGTVMARYAGFSSMRVGNGLLMEGINAGSQGQKGIRLRVQQALAAMVAAGENPLLVGHVHWIGTNDKNPSKANPAEFGPDLEALVADFKASIPGYGAAKIVLPRVQPGANAAIIRAAQQSLATADPQVYLVDTDDQATHDGTHFNMAGEIAVGQRCAEVIVGASNGV